MVEEQETLPFDNDKNVLLMSALQKQIRVGNVPEAMLVAADLCRMSPDTLWSRINICAREESGQALEYAAVFALWLEYQKERTKLEKDRNMGLQLIRAMTATQILAMSKKDGRSDELFHLILSAEDGHTTPQELLDALRQNAGAPIPDVAYAMHVGR
jgi:hypothetical protein